jgi:hypothetical protein
VEGTSRAALPLAPECADLRHECGATVSVQFSRLCLTITKLVGRPQAATRLSVTRVMRICWASGMVAVPSPGCSASSSVRASTHPGRCRIANYLPGSSANPINLPGGRHSWQAFAICGMPQASPTSNRFRTVPRRPPDHGLVGSRDLCRAVRPAHPHRDPGGGSQKNSSSVRPSQARARVKYSIWYIGCSSVSARFPGHEPHRTQALCPHLGAAACRRIRTRPRVSQSLSVLGIGREPGHIRRCQSVMPLPLGIPLAGCGQG